MTESDNNRKRAVEEQCDGSTEESRSQKEIKRSFFVNKNGEREAMTENKTRKKQRTIQIVTYTIRNGRQGGLESAVRTLKWMNVDIALMQETKINNESCYTRESFGYKIQATKAKAKSKFQGGIALIYRPSDFWTIESVRCYDPNVITFILVTGRKRYSCMGAYILPIDNSTIETIQHAVDKLPKYNPIILLGDLNADINNPHDNATTDVELMVSMYGLEDMVRHFKQRHKYRKGNTRRMRWRERMVESHIDYSLCSDRRVCKKCSDQRSSQIILQSWEY
jgi:exonuclease III